MTLSGGNLTSLLSVSGKRLQRVPASGGSLSTVLAVCASAELQDPESRKGGAEALNTQPEGHFGGRCVAWKPSPFPAFENGCVPLRGGLLGGSSVMGYFTESYCPGCDRKGLSELTLGLFLRVSDLERVIRHPFPGGYPIWFGFVF